MNDPAAYEFFSGHDRRDRPVWARDFEQIRPLLNWNNHCGCVTVTYIPGLKLYLMFGTDGWPTAARMSTAVFESAAITGPWRLVTFMKDFGQRAHFVHIPSWFVAPSGRTACLCYSANFARDWGPTPILSDPPGSRYGLVLQEILLRIPSRSLGRFKCKSHFRLVLSRRERCRASIGN